MPPEIKPTDSAKPSQLPTPFNEPLPVPKDNKLSNVVSTTDQGANSIEVIKNNFFKRKSITKECWIEWPGVLPHQSPGRFQINGSFSCKKGAQIFRVIKSGDPRQHYTSHR